MFFIVYTSLTVTYNLAVFQSQQRIDLNGDIQYETLTILLHYFYYVINIRDTWQTLISCFFFSFPRCSCLFFSLSFLDFLLCSLSNVCQRLLRVSFPDFPFSRDSQLCNTCIFHRFSRVSHSVSRLLERVLIFRYFSAPSAGFFLVSSILEKYLPPPIALERWRIATTERRHRKQLDRAHLYKHLRSEN